MQVRCLSTALSFHGGVTQSSLGQPHRAERGLTRHHRRRRRIGGVGVGGGDDLPICGCVEGH